MQTGDDNVPHTYKCTSYNRSKGISVNKNTTTKLKGIEGTNTSILAGKITATILSHPTFLEMKLSGYVFPPRKTYPIRCLFFCICSTWWPDFMFFTWFVRTTFEPSYVFFAWWTLIRYWSHGPQIIRFNIVKRTTFLDSFNGYHKVATRQYHHHRVESIAFAVSRITHTL